MPDLGLDTSYRQNKFFKILIKKSFEFILNNKNSIVALNLSFVLLLAEIDLILEKKKL